MKWLALAGALLLTGLLVPIGLTMANPALDDSYAMPLRVSFGLGLALPVAYWRLARRVMAPREGALWTGAMAGVALLLWLPLFADPAMRAEHGKVLAIWTALWTVASLPMLRAGVKGLRRPKT